MGSGAGCNGEPSEIICADWRMSILGQAKDCGDSTTSNAKGGALFGNPHKRLEFQTSHRLIL